VHIRPLLLAFVIAIGLAATLQAADVNGKWTGQVPGRDGQTRETTFTFKADGESVTGSMSGAQGETPIANGRLQADKLSFDVTLNFQGNTVLLHFRGVVSGDEIKFTRQREGADRLQEFTATRVK
jgi:opacity protein-like surface antigen